MPQEQLHDLRMSSDHGPMQWSLAIATVHRQVHTLVQQELNHAFFSVSTCVPEPLLHLFLRSVRFQTADVLTKEGLDHIEPSKRSGSRQVDVCTTAGEKFGGLRASVCQAADHHGL